MTAGGNGARGWDHQVQFYDSDDFLLDNVSDYLAAGLHGGEPVVILSTTAHRAGLATRIDATGLSWDSARLSRRLRWLEARAVLENIMVGRKPDRERFVEQVGGLIDGCAPRDGGNVRVYGELVDLLWREGNADGAIRLEDFWNELAEGRQLSLLCGYSRGAIYGDERSRRIREVCDRHGHVRPVETMAERRREA